ncbi:CcmD family protein [Pedobacter sp. UYP24]
MKKLLMAFLLIISSVSVFAQDGGIEMADAMRSNGKIYVVVVCIVIILVGLLSYLFSLDKRLKKLEKK